MGHLDETRRPFCVFCGEKTEFARPPLEVKTRVGARRRLAGVCAVCGHEVSCFLSSDTRPTVRSIRVGDAIWREVQRGSALLRVSQRAIVENILMERLEGFIDEQLAELEAAGLITAAERRKRERELREPIERWRPPVGPGEEPTLFSRLRALLE